MIRLLDLFSGIGGFSLGLERTGGFQTVAFCEIDPFCKKVLAKHWPEVPCYHDIRELTAERLAADGIGVDAICGGFPCQDISVAGKGEGMAGERSGLWSEYARLIGELRPRYVIVENVSALLNRGLDVVLGDLAKIGYDAEWHCIPASAVGAPHRRDRIWIVAYSNHCGRWGREGSAAQIQGGQSIADGSGAATSAHPARSGRGRVEPGRGPLWRDTNAAGNGESGNAHDVSHAISGELRHEPGRRDGASWPGEAIAADDGKQGLMANTEGERCGEAREHSEHFAQRIACGSEILAEAGFIRCDGRPSADADIDPRHERRPSNRTQIAGGRHPDRGGVGADDMANADSRGREGQRLPQHGEQQSAPRGEPDGRSEAGWRPGQDVGHAISARLEGRFSPRDLELPGKTQSSGPARAPSAVLAIAYSNEWRRTATASDWWLFEPDVGRVANGVPSRVDRLRSLGNAVVPQIPEMIGRAILASEEQWPNDADESSIKRPV